MLLPELQSLAAYVIAAIHRDDVRSTEAGLKYFVLGGLSSGMLLYGASLVYGFTGTVSFPAIAGVLTTGAPPIGLVLGILTLVIWLNYLLNPARALFQGEKRIVTVTRCEGSGLNQSCSGTWSVQVTSR